MSETPSTSTGRDPSNDDTRRSALQSGARNPVLVVVSIVGGAVLLGGLIAGVLLYQFAQNGRPLSIRLEDEEVVVRAAAVQELAPQYSVRTEAESMARRRFIDGTIRLSYSYRAPPPQSLRLRSELSRLPEPCEDQLAETIQDARQLLVLNYPDSKVRAVDQIVAWGSDQYWVGEAFREVGDSEEPTGYAFVGCDGHRLYSVFMTSDDLDIASRGIFLRAVSESIDRQRGYRE